VFTIFYLKGFTKYEKIDGLVSEFNNYPPAGHFSYETIAKLQEMALLTYINLSEMLDKLSLYFKKSTIIE
jgi:hypothetical protein